LPTVIDLNRYDVRSLPDSAIITIGWIGTPSTAKYLTLIKDALKEVYAACQIRIIIVGLSDLFLEGVPLEFRKWSEETEVNDIQQFDIGIMPLSDDPWSRGKCGYKLTQYMACAKPVIASPVGINSKIVQHGYNGFLATTKSEWIAALTALIKDGELRKKMGLVGRYQVEQEYSLQKSAPKLLKLLTTISTSYLNN